MRKYVLCAMAGIVSLIAVQQAFAIPALQLYIPGAEYVNETWITSDTSFELWVIASQDVNDVYLTMAVPEVTGEITLSSRQISNFVYGNPGYAPHDIYDSWYGEYFIDDMIIPAQGADTVYNMVDLSEAGTDGMIVKFDVNVSDFDYVHFDARGNGFLKNDKAVTFAPFSHDAGTSSPVPEPATMSLFGLGLAGLIGRRLRKVKA